MCCGYDVLQARSGVMEALKWSGSEGDKERCCGGFPLLSAMAGEIRGAML
jgi:hypothetical protein